MQLCAIKTRELEVEPVQLIVKGSAKHQVPSGAQGLRAAQAGG
jgi:hypothetical protein